MVEFKKAEKNFDFDDLGKYFSALSNEANLRGLPFAWLTSICPCVQDARRRYFLDPSEILETADGVRFAVCTQRNYRNFPRISDIITDFLGYKLEEV